MYIESVCVFSAFLNAIVTIKSPMCRFQSIVKLLTSSGRRGCLSLKRNGYGFGLLTSMFQLKYHRKCGFNKLRLSKFFINLIFLLNATVVMSFSSRTHVKNPYCQGIQMFWLVCFTFHKGVEYFYTIKVLERSREYLMGTVFISKWQYLYN